MFAFYRFLLPFSFSFLGSALGAVASIGGALIGSRSTRSSNAKSADMAREQMKFQERMSNTGYQRAVKDMKEAGLNPMLAYSQGPASTPSGAMAEAKPEFGGDVGSSAVAAAAQSAQVQQMKAQVNNIKADTENKHAEAENIQADTELKRTQRGTESYRPQLVTNQAQAARATAEAMERQLYPLIQKIQAETDTQRATASQIRSQNLLVKDLMDNPVTRPFAPLLQMIFGTQR